MTRLFRPLTGLSFLTFVLATLLGVGCSGPVAERTPSPDTAAGDAPEGVQLADAAGVAGLRLPAGGNAAPAGDEKATADELVPFVSRAVCEILRQGHLHRPAIDDEASRRTFRQFLRNLDPQRLYFTQSDIEEFKKQETELDDQLLQGDIRFAREVQERFLKRHGERLKLVEELLNVPHDFTAKETMETKAEKLTWAKSDEELRDRWRKRVKYELLLQKVGPTPPSEAEAKQKVLSRYRSLNKFWHQSNTYDLLEIYLSSLAASVDPHSSYLSPSSWEDMVQLQLQLHLEGIGARLRSEDGFAIVDEIVPGGAAALDGRLQPKDKIIGVAQGDSKFVDIRDMRLKDAVRLIRGPRGTKVQLEVIPAGMGGRVVYELTREKVELKEQEAAGEIIEEGKKADGTPYRIGVVGVPAFYGDDATDGKGKSATEDVRRILKEFQAKKVDGVILDLRDNGGGLLREARSMTGLFIDEGPVVQVKAGPGKVRVLDDPEQGTVYDGPLMVLTNRFSASASEILAGALQDYGRALVVGDSSTFGKGTVQTILPIGDQLQQAGGRGALKLGALKLTIQQFYRVNGDSTQNKGVVPDIILPSLKDHLGAGEKELDYALAFDHIDPAKHPNLGRVPAELKKSLAAKSAERVKASPDFAKLGKEIERLEARRARGTVSLNEKELKGEIGDDDPAEDGERPNPKRGKAKENGYKFHRDFINNEVLKIMDDYLKGLSRS